MSTTLDGPVASGLTHEQAGARLAEVGRNVLAEPKRPSSVRRFGANLVHLFALLLWLGAALALLGGLPQLTAAIVVVILVNAVFAFVQESRAERANGGKPAARPTRRAGAADGESPGTTADKPERRSGVGNRCGGPACRPEYWLAHCVVRYAERVLLKTSPRRYPTPSRGSTSLGHVHGAWTTSR